MKTIESIGKNIEEAISKGLDQLGVTREQAQINILDEGSKGVFGMFGTKLARVAISVPDNEAIGEPAEPNQADIPEQPEVQEEEAVAPECADHPAYQFISELARLMDLPQPHITIEDGEEGAIRVMVDGPNVGPFIGHHGDCLEAMQLLTMLVVNPQGRSGADYHRVMLDVGGYRQRREQTLVRLAQRLATKVLDTGEPVELEPMNAYERRIIHTALGDFEGIATWSEGEEPYRHIVIDLEEYDDDYDEEYDDEEYEDEETGESEQGEPDKE